MDGKNKYDMLIFSTHYPELLDEYDRNDSILLSEIEMELQQKIFQIF